MLTEVSAVLNLKIRMPLLSPQDRDPFTVSKRIPRERKTVMVSALMVFGFALLLLLSEVQPRYKTVVYPFMAVVSAYGIYCIIQPIWLLIKRFYREKSI